MARRLKRRAKRHEFIIARRVAIEWRHWMAAIRAPSNRGLLLDVFVFFLNLFAMTALGRVFFGVVRRAAADDQSAMSILFGMAVALFVLAPLGATLKRWDYHRRRRGKASEFEEDPMGGCFFNPIFYFCLTALIFATVNAFLIQNIYGKNEPDGGVFVGSILGGIALMITHTVLVYRFFSVPEKPPRWGFLAGPSAAVAGDVCLFLNMALFQLIWNLASTVDMPRPTGIFDFAFRLMMVFFVALLLYFPPRMFYLADDLGKRRTWIFIGLANLPMLIRVVWGTSQPLHW